MNIQGLLDYAKIDDELTALNRKFNTETAVAEYKSQTKRRNDALEALTKLNADAAELIAKVSAMTERYEQAKVQFEEAQANFEHIEDENEADYYSKKLEDLVALLSQLTQDIGNVGKQISDIRAQYTKVASEGADAGKRLKAVNEEYKKTRDAYQPLFNEVKARLDKAGEGLGDALDRYLSLKKSKVKRPLVTLNGNTCGGCFMDIDEGSMNSLKQNGYVICQNCGRIIYQKKD